MSRHQLAQLNIGRLAAPLDSPQLAGFVDNLDRINALAERSDGFVWRLVGEGNDATSLRPYNDPMMIVNMSVWRDVASLHAYVYRTAHVEVMKHRREYFETMREAYTVLWWVPAGHRPTVDEAMERLEWLRRDGPGEHAFTFKRAFAPPDAADPAEDSFGDLCPA